MAFIKYKETKIIVPMGAKVSILSYQAIFRGELSAINDTGKDIELIIKEPDDSFKDLKRDSFMTCKMCGEMEMGFVDIAGEKIKICKDCIAENLHMLKWK